MSGKVPLLKPAHVKARLKFDNDHLDDPEESGESHVVRWEIFGHNSTNRVWRKKNDEYHPTNTMWSMGVVASYFGMFLCTWDRVTALY